MHPAKKLVLGIPVSLNQADADDLALIPGISHSLAHRIVDFRDSSGPFRSLNDLDRVKGVGPKKLERLSSYLSAEEKVP
jgi:competence ComEA-like helix-hairpin-helix protein